MTERSYTSALKRSGRDRAEPSNTSRLGRVDTIRMNTLTSADLLRRMAGGDTEAFGVVYDRYASRALGLIVHILGSRDGAEEILQEVFWRVWRKASSYDVSRGAVDVWVLLITRSMAIDALRKRARQDALTEAARQYTIEFPHHDGSSAEEAAEIRDAAREAFDRLPSEQREVIGLAFYRGLSHSQIAHVRSLPLGTVKTRVRNGMLALREYMTQHSNKAQTP